MMETQKQTIHTLLKQINHTEWKKTNHRLDAYLDSLWAQTSDLLLTGGLGWANSEIPASELRDELRACGGGGRYNLSGKHRVSYLFQPQICRCAMSGPICLEITCPF